MKRRSSELTFTLFPFLAVLMCTMGALILILLVTTRKIRQNAVAAALAQQLQQQQADTAVPPTWTPLARTAPVPLLPWKSLQPPAVQPERLPLPPTGPSPAELARQEYEKSLRLRTAEQASLDSNWLGRQRQLEQQLATAKTHLQTLQRSVQQAQSAYESVQQQRDALAANRDQLMASQQSLATTAQQATNESQRLQIKLSGLQSQIEQSKIKARERRPQLSVVAHDPQAGTTRRPILMEAHADRLVFPSEQITLSTRELDGFNPDINPVRAITETLMKHWTAVDTAAGADQPEPYVLVLVRPQGVVGFLVICQMLQEVKTPSGKELRFGYELVLADDEFLFPGSDPVAVTECRRALEQVLTQKPATASRVRSSPAAQDHLQFSANDGSFRLQEVDRLRNVDDPYAIANPWVSPHGEKAGGRPTFSRAQPTNRNPSNQPPDFLRPGPPSGGEPAQAASGGTPGTGKNTGTGTGPQAESASESSGAATSAPPLLAPPQGQPTFNRNPQSNSTGSSAAAGMPTLSPVDSMPNLQRLVPPSQTQQGQAAQAERNPLPATPWEAAQGSLADGPREPEWLSGQRVPSKAIGVERDVVLDVWGDRLEVLESDLRQPIPEQITREELQGLVAQILSLDVRTWGPAPAGFVWRPYLKVVIHPGGNLHAKRIEELAKSWGVKLRMEQALE